MRNDSNMRWVTDWKTWYDEEGVEQGPPIADQNSGPFLLIADGSEGYTVWQQDGPPHENEEYLMEEHSPFHCCRILRFNKEENCFEEWDESEKTWQLYVSQ